MKSSTLILLFKSFILMAGCKTSTNPSLTKMQGLVSQTESGDSLPQSFSSHGAFACQDRDQSGKTTRRQCIVGGKTIDVLVQRGSLAENARDQAILQANAIDQGPLSEIEDQVAHTVSAVPDPTKLIMYDLLACFAGHIKQSTTPDFSEAIDASIAGYFLGHQGRSPFTKAALLRSVIGIELGSILTKYQYAFETGTPAQVQSALVELRDLCPEVMGRAEAAITFLFKSGVAGRLPTRAGCSGIVVSGEKTTDSSLIHGRNLDGDVTQSWSEHPSLHLIAEPGFLKFFAIGTAGLFYPGGVSGVNERGLSVSIHQMYATHPRVRVAGRRAAIGPWVLQHILRAASSINDAIKIAQSFEHLATWTLLVADGKTAEAASIEIAPGKVVVSRRVNNSHLSQSNHMFADSMLDEAFFPYLNKRLETLSRNIVLDRLSQDAPAHSIDPEWMMAALSSHIDAFEGPRAFGRTVSKVYTMMSTVAVPAPKDGGLPQLWFTIGDKFPRTHSMFVGFSVDFGQEKVVPLAAKQAVWGKSRWEESLSAYTLGHLANRAGKAEEAILHVRRAIALAAEDKVREPAYDYILARLLQKVGQHENALTIFRDLDLNAETLKIHPYQRVLIRLNGLIASDRLGGNTGTIDPKTRHSWIAEAKQELNNLREPRISTNIDYLLNLFAMLKARIPVTEAAVDFMIVE